MNNYLLNITLFVQEILTDQVRDILKDKYIPIVKAIGIETEVFEIIGQGEPGTTTFAAMSHFKCHGDSIETKNQLIDTLSSLLHDAGYNNEDVLLFPTLMNNIL